MNPGTVELGCPLKKAAAFFLNGAFSAFREVYILPIGN
jgi:hypothetical protein